MGRLLGSWRLNSVALLLFVSAVSCAYLPELGEFDLPPELTLYETREYMSLVRNDRAENPVGFMFYPGALVDPHSYIPSFSGLAARGIPVMIIKHPGNLAIFDPGIGLSLKDEVPGVTDWVIGGHSLGGAMAAWVARDQSAAFKGVVLLAAYPAESKSLAQTPMRLLSISAEFDGLATREKLSQAEALLPTPVYRLEDSGSAWPASGDSYSVAYEIAGGNHAGFGAYGLQEGDGVASISPEAQHAEAEEAIYRFFMENGWMQP